MPDPSLSPPTLSSSPLPGSPAHQALLNTLITHYADRDDLLGLYLFGSLAKGNWDEHSDLDVAVVLPDHLRLDLPNELAHLSATFAAQGEAPLFVEHAGDEGYIVLPSLRAIAIRYHTVAATSPYLLEGCSVLSGSLDLDMLYQAARANDFPAPALSQQLHRALWLALGVDINLQRQQFWPALQGLERLRDALLEIYATSRGGKRVHQFFEVTASDPIKRLFGQTLPHYNPASTTETLRALDDALMALLDLLEQHLPELSNRQATLASGESQLITQLRTRAQVRYH